jgi:hypothetical protein
VRETDHEITHEMHIEVVDGRIDDKSKMTSDQGPHGVVVVISQRKRELYNMFAASRRNALVCFCR